MPKRRKSTRSSAKNTKEVKNVHPAVVLGDTDVSSDDSLLNRSNVERNSDFATPETPDNTTNYDLEFTSHLGQRNPRRSSTLRLGTGSNNQFEREQQDARLRHQIRNSRQGVTTPIRSNIQVNLVRSPTVAVASTSRLSAQNVRASMPANTSVSRRKNAPSQNKRSAFYLNKQFFNEVEALRKQTTPLIPRLSFGNLVRQMLNQCSRSHLRISLEALKALQECTEMYLTQRFEDSYLLTLHRNRCTLQVEDMRLLALFKQ